ncbi:hypothetical protein ACLOJK_041240 [Asimina triloba]
MKLELNFAVNVAGTFAMTELLLPLLEKAAPDARFSESKFDGTTQYARNKRVQVALTAKWAQMYTMRKVLDSTQCIQVGLKH